MGGEGRRGREGKGSGVPTLGTKGRAQSSLNCHPVPPLSAERLAKSARGTLTVPLARGSWPAVLTLWGAGSRVQRICELE